MAGVRANCLDCGHATLASDLLDIYNVYKLAKDFKAVSQCFAVRYLGIM